MKNILLLLSFALLCLPAYSIQQGKKEKGFDKNGQRDGKWCTYYDQSKGIKDKVGKYKHGEQVGKWKYYTHEGILYKEERYNLRKHRIHTKIYKNGKLLKTGKARIVDEPDGIHYYWYGEWKYYNENGKLEKIIIYDNGKAVNTIIKDK